jgi:hypothetical protein
VPLPITTEASKVHPGLKNTSPQSKSVAKRLENFQAADTVKPPKEEAIVIEPQPPQGTALGMESVLPEWATDPQGTDDRGSLNPNRWNWFILSILLEQPLFLLGSFNRNNY